MGVAASEVERWKSEVCERVDAFSGELLAVSHEIHAHPELAFREERAADRLCNELSRAGLAPERSAWSLDTAFETRVVDREGPTVAILAEYDALPGIGHSCGHNLIATAALGAGLALRSLADVLPGRVRLVGTPAEEAGGGKEIMARAGAFEGVDAAMMVHPAGVDLVTMPCIALAEVEAEYHGRAAHASSMPERGVNALDGLVIAYSSLAALRQHIGVNERIHGIITDGGQAPNVVPEHAAGRFYVRARDARELGELKRRVDGCFQAGAAATGARLDLRWQDPDYLELRTAWPLARAYQRNAERLGRQFFPYDRLPPGVQGSTDMGNVSHRVPSIHPMIAAAPPHVTIHHPDFASWAGSALGDRAALDGAKALAMTAIDFLVAPALRDETRERFAEAMR